MQDLINNVERMTSIEIAEVTGKPHNDVLKAIRKMEPAWEKVHEGKFSLKQRTIQTSNGATRQVPYYSLIRMPMPVHCLPTEKAMIAVVDDIRQDLISLENMDARPCYTITEIAMMLNIQRRTLNKLLVAQGIQTHKNGRYYIDDHYKGRGLCEERFFHYYALDGEKKERSYMVWTDRGVDFIKDLLESENLFGLK